VRKYIYFFIKQYNIWCPIHDRLWTYTPFELRMPSSQD
jgi:hypothetical protein